ncbi:phage tail protein [Chimaeribacter californicus]|uniref:Phage tail protein n=1 Tax=Chimaeribacter californicus TaxID=2060067 RepID=A0A2N5EEJ5_9GAMM|nr:phage tail protein [Chimaeribacter californicus]PLR40932.1 phage tail protein [Chimaeribacter californicus]
MLMTLGMMVFKLQTLPFETMAHKATFRWPANSRVGARPAAQFLGPDAETITLTGTLMPEVTGGQPSLIALQAIAQSGCAWPLIAGNGLIYGMYVVKEISDTHSELTARGEPQKIVFTLTLQRVDENLVAMFGDLAAQAKALPGKAAGALSNLGG